MSCSGVRENVRLFAFFAAVLMDQWVLGEIWE